jgi:two-component system chemotaxis response regulator CheB
VLRLDKNPPENFCRPAVDPMLRSLAKVYGGKVLTLILTGMGQDGMKGGKEIINAGGVVVAQDEGTSVVWGMPGAVTGAGLCSAVLPLSDIAPFLRKTLSRMAA